MKCNIRKLRGARPSHAMNFLERIPTRWLLTGAALACLALWAAPSVAQTSGDAANGKLLFEDTPNESGMPQLGSCTNCHGSVQNRRIQIGGNAFADISFGTAHSRFGSAIGTQSGMTQFQALSSGQIADIAAYIADSPKVTATGLTALNTLAFQSSAVGNAVTRNITINHSVATTDNLQITGLTLSAGTTAFTRTGTCTTLSAAGTCTFSMTFTPTSTTAESKVLTIALRQGSVNFSRTVTLNGSVAGVVTPPPPSGGGDDGGDALGWAWLTGLALATAVLARRRRT